MKTVIVWVVCLGVTSAAHADSLFPQGTEAQLKVEYVFTSSGRYTSPAKDVVDTWSARRVVNLTGQYKATAPKAAAVLQTNDAKYNAQLANAQALVARAQKDLKPMQMSMMAMAEKCGITMDGPEPSAAEEKAQEACMEKAGAEYGNSMQMTPEMSSAIGDAAAVQNSMSATRFQSWELTSQSGTYSIDKKVSKQVFGETCTDIKVCKREEITKGSGPIPAPAGGGSAAGSSILEVDSTGHVMILKLPMPMVPLPITTTVTSTIEDDRTKGGPGLFPLWAWPANNSITVPITPELKSFSGTKSFPIAGRQVEAGTLTVKWHFTRL